MSYFDKSPYVKELSPKDFNKIVSYKLNPKMGKCAMVLFYKPGCPYCKAVKNEWENLGKKSAFMEVYAMNSEKHYNHIAKIREELPDLIYGYPTIVAYKNGMPVEKLLDTDRNIGKMLELGMRTCQLK